MNLTQYTKYIFATFWVFFNRKDGDRCFSLHHSLYYSSNCYGSACEINIIIQAQ